MPNNNNNNKAKGNKPQGNNKPQRPPQKKGNRKPATVRMRNEPSMQMTNVPFQSAITIQQSAMRNVTTLVGSEYVGSVQIGGATPANTAQTFYLSPGGMVGTRLASMAKLFQRFRFISAELLINCNMSTATNGSLVAGYTSNSDWEPQPLRAAGQIYSLPGAKSVRLWTPTRVNAVMTPLVPNAWYVNDADSAEIMWTNQGKFVVAIESQANLEIVTTIPVMLNYKVQFALPVDSMPAATTAIVFPQTEWSGAATGYYTVITATTGEGALPTLTAKQVYELMPAPAITLTSAGSAQLLPVLYVLYYTSKYYLYTAENLDAARQLDTSKAIQLLPAAWATPRMVGVPT